MRKSTIKQGALIFVLLMLSTTLFAQGQKITVRLKDATLQQLFSSIEKESSYRFSYRNSVIDKYDVSITINSKDLSVGDILTEALNGTTLSFKIISDESITITDKVDSRLENKGKPTSISGKVVDENGAPIVGATLLVKNSNVGTITSVDGKYSLNVKTGDQIECTYFGYDNVSIYVTESKTVHNIVMKEAAVNIEEVVVTALGIKRSEKALGYSVQKVAGDDLNVVKGVNVTSAMTGKIAGLNILNSTEFAASSSVELRGESPLLVIDGVPYGNMSLNDIASDDIESMSVLKGATASALYGSRGGSGAIIVTTKKGGVKDGLSVNINSSTIFEAGYTIFPEVQSSYSGGMSGKYDEDFVWGDKLDIGRTATQWDPIAQEWSEQELVSRGKDNLKNFLQTGLVSNNNISIAYNGEKGGFRSSLTYVHNKGQYPNTKQNKLTYTLGGDIKLDRFTFEGNVTFNKRFYPNNFGSGYGTGGYLYNILVWSGADYNLSDYKDYWIKGKENEKQSWWTESWYDNPWFIANEITRSSDHNFTNGFLSAKYDIIDGLDIVLRTGFDVYTTKTIERNAKSAIGGWDINGYYYQKQSTGYSTNNDLIITYDKSWGKFGLNILGGGTLYYYLDENLWQETNNGLSVPGFYSIYASVDTPNTGSGRGQKQVNSLYSKASLSWDNYLYVDITARNDWSSALPQSTRSYFYPSVAGSFILSEVVNMPSWWEMLKLRGSWTQTKSDISIYDITNVYNISTNMWDGLSGAYYPGTLRPDDLTSQSSKTYEIGLNAHWLKNRIWLDATYYNKVNTDFVTTSPMSDASGYNGFYVNSDEERQRAGIEITIGGEPIRTTDFSWTSSFNWSRSRYTYKKLDQNYSSNDPWVKEGERVDTEIAYYMFDTTEDGEIVHGSNGLPIYHSYDNLVGYSDPSWIWGFNNTFKYKNWSLNLQFDGRVGGTSFNMMNQSLMNSGAHIDTDTPERYEEVVNGNINYVGKGVKVVSGSVERDEYGNVVSDDRVFEPNNKAVSYESYIRNYYFGRYSPVPHSYCEETFFKLRELSLAYTLPSSLAKKLGVPSMTVSFVGNNLWLWTKEYRFADPDVGSDNLNSPSMRYLGFNLNISF